MKRFAAVACLLWMLTLAQGVFAAWAGQTPVCGYEVLNQYPHDPRAFTQGLIFDQGVLYESTGRWHESSIRKVDLTTGEILLQKEVAGTFFAEGLTRWKQHLIQLTWQAEQGFFYTPDTLDEVRTFKYEGEGWGLTHDDQFLIMSNGSNVLQFLDPQTLEVKRSLAVFDQARPVERLNELEYINGEIFANIWRSNFIARINPETGEVNSWLNLIGIKPRQMTPDPQAVLNGIAYDAEQGRLFITGKLWPQLFEIRITDCPSAAMPNID